MKKSFILAAALLGVSFASYAQYGQPGSLGSRLGGIDCAGCNPSPDWVRAQAEAQQRAQYDQMRDQTRLMEQQLQEQRRMREQLEIDAQRRAMRH